MEPNQQASKDSPKSITSPSPALSQSSTVFDTNSPRAPIRHRATFARLASADDGRYEAIKDEDDITDANPYNDSNPAHGLGISIPGDRPKSNKPLLSDDMKGGYSVETHEMPTWSTHHNAKQSVTSFQSSIRQNTAYTPDTERLRNRQSFADSLRMAYDDFVPGDTCAAHTNFHHGRSYWLSITIMILAVYSTIFSAIFLILALRGPRYKWVRETGGVMTPDHVNLMTAFFAKTIELSFATVFVSFLGQVLSRRAFMKNQGRGVTLAEFDMRSWVMQPGTLITHWAAAKTSLLSFLGVLSLVAAIVAMLYTTASEALVQPQLRFGPWEFTTLQGLVKASFANGPYLAEVCPTPIGVAVDSVSGTTCLQIQYAAQGYHNYQRYISDWATVANNGNGSSDLTKRPKGFALLYENTTVTAPWIEISDVNETSTKYNRVVNNVTLAMPHAGVPAAARDAINGILQPEDLNGQGVYNLRASVPSPAVNVLCANLNETELAPLVWTAWNNKLNVTTWQTGEETSWYQAGNYLNSTVVDDLFGWGEKYEVSPPIFPRYPNAYNTLLNHTGVWARPAIYILGKGTGEDYSLCSIKVFQTPFCSTRYNASSSGAQLEAVCAEQDNRTDVDPMSYIHSLSNATSGSANLNHDWVSMASEWANSLSLNAGITDGDASNARLLTELMLPDKSTSLNAGLPSMAEAISVLAGCTLLMSSSSAPYVQFWNYSKTTLEPGQYQYFNASLRAQEYSSGGSGEAAAHGFFVVLIAVLILNLICLAYFIRQNGLVTDFSEPLNLFSLAVNSPPSDVMAGSCAAGPRGQQYRVSWFVNAAGEHLYMENKIDRGDGMLSPPPPPPPQPLGHSGQTDPAKTPLRRAVEKLSHRTSWL